MFDSISQNLNLLALLDTPIPRYTSYPTANLWHPLKETDYIPFLEKISHDPSPLSLYIHIPFCRSMCLFCGCHVVLNRNPRVEEEYTKTLLSEIHLIKEFIGTKMAVSQIHFGGGTPTKLEESLLLSILETLYSSFHVTPDAEVCVEIDPRSLHPERFSLLDSLIKKGVNRFSMGVQDTEEEVQKKIRRNQSAALSKLTVEKAREAGCREINLDLIYGLPGQTKESFARTLEDIIEISPERIALFSFAYTPWIKPHQKALNPEEFPDRKNKLELYFMALQKLEDAGYLRIGMDHFCKAHTKLAESYNHNRLYRNFQGYSVQKADRMVSFGVSAISDMGSGFFQNTKNISTYKEQIALGLPPIERGYLLTKEDEIHRYTIMEMMCRFSVDKKRFLHLFGIPFDTFFGSQKERLKEAFKAGLLEEDSHSIFATDLGKLFIRNAAFCFDAHNKPQKNLFSQAI